VSDLHDSHPDFRGPLLKRPRVIDKDARRKDDDARWRAVCLAVDKRDKMRCRACGCKCLVTMALVGKRLERHHIILRSQGGEDTATNVLSLCKLCHDARHVTHDLDISGDANGVAVFERAGRIWESEMVNGKRVERERAA
jgi:hypothetical protein